MLVYVINKNGNKLMPCSNAKARKLLRDGKAHVVCREPFTIQLNWDCEENVQDVTLGIDKGAYKTGFSCVGNGKILMSGVLAHRRDIKKRMDQRRNNRRSRRQRKWHRPPRFLNRANSNRKGRLNPSVKANVEEVLRVVRKIPLPISNIVLEQLTIDMDRLNNPNREKRLDENLRIATLMRDGYRCTQCGKSKCRLHAHHVLWKSRGGTDVLDNLITVCDGCHRDIHSGKLMVRGKINKFANILAQRTMMGKTYLGEELSGIASLERVVGSKTSSYRKKLGLPKEHDVDAMCVATLLSGEVVPYNRDNFFDIKFRPSQTRRQFYDLPRKGKGRVRYQVNRELGGFRKGDVVLVKGKWVKWIHSIYSQGLLAFPRVSGEPGTARPKNCRLLQGSPTVLWQRGMA